MLTLYYKRKYRNYHNNSHLTYYLFIAFISSFSIIRLISILKSHHHHHHHHHHLCFFTLLSLCLAVGAHMPVLHCREVCLTVISVWVGIDAYRSICGKIQIYESLKMNKVHFEAEKG